MSKPARAGRIIGWIAVGTVLTAVFYLPVWFVVGAMLYGGTHPDYWSWATPDHIIPIAAVLSSVLLLLGRWLARKLGAPALAEEARRANAQSL
ncbi:MAG TPA: hypothetical protein VI168_14490 [Croceibacterium sp.]